VPRYVSHARLGVASVLFTTLALILGAISALTALTPPGVAQATLLPAPGPVHAVFLGDSYTFGVGATVPTDGYAYLVARAEHWTSRVVGLPGSGYVRVALRDDKNISAGLASVTAAQPQVVVVECGHNDAMPRVAYTRTKAAAVRDLSALRAALPDATIVVVGPVWLNGYPGGKALYVRRAIHLAQQSVPGTLWIDPIAEHWFTGSWSRRTGDDATMINYAAGHPNDLGYAHMARRLEADLEALGVR
jgi:lysophospholipase L1-like esterase